MKKVQFLSLVLIVALIATFGQNFRAADFSTVETIDFDIASSEYTLNEAPKLSYVVYGFTSLDANAPEEYKTSSQYIENYSVEFIYPDSNNTMRQNSFAHIVKTGTIDIMNTNCISVPTTHISHLRSNDIEIPLITEDIKKEVMASSKEGIKSVLRSVSVNVFFVNPEDNNASDHLFLQKSNIIPLNARADFANMSASIYAIDQYDGSKKRQLFTAYHSKHDLFNRIPGGNAFVNTGRRDTRPDVITLGWGLGGAIAMNDSSIGFRGQYNMQCSVCQIADREKFASNTFTPSSSNVTKHDSLFTGVSIGYNIPDTGPGYCPYCGESIATYPSQLYITAKNGWYNRGGYNGEDGTARTDYYHTYVSRTLTVSASISTSLIISFTPNLALDEECEKSWVYTVISPN